MNRYLVDRLEDIADALPSASRDSLEDLEKSLNDLLVEVRRRLADERSDAETVRLTHAEVRAASTQA